MALRVLLADESSTIKKVFQLALQDFGVEVQPVNVGLDVLAVAKRFKPDIVFADILLQKKDGYDVSAELKNDAETKETPVVLMWSGFMELDEDKIQISQANAQLEKPFDVKTLRKIIHELVPKTRDQKLSGYLSFPKMPDFIAETAGAPPAPAAPSSEAESKPADWNMESFETLAPELVPQETDSFQAVALPTAKEEEASTTSPSLLLDLEDEAEDQEDSAWEQKDLSRFHLKEDPGTLDEEIPVSYSDPEEEPSPAPISAAPEGEDVELEVEASLPPPIQKTSPSQKIELSTSSSVPALSEEKLEELIRAQSKEIIEAVVWKIVPEIATNIVERELKRLLNERDNQPTY